MYREAHLPFQKKKSISVVQRFTRNNYILYYLQCIDLDKFAANIFIESAWKFFDNSLREKLRKKH